MAQTPAGPAPVSPAPAAGRMLHVDQRGGAEYTSLMAAAQAAQPGDTIVIAPGSGPYRETLLIPRSGTLGAPITVEGNGETVTGFKPIQFQKAGNDWVCDLGPVVNGFKSVQQFHRVNGIWVNDDEEKMGRPMPAFPSVLTYKGERLRQDAKTGQFTKYATITPDWKLTLLPGSDPEGWELASLPFVVQIHAASYQTFRNLRASGSLNDGFNGHGGCHNLIFENVEGFENLDEGFSIHDDIQAEIHGGRFYQNDNGICNAVSVVTLTDVDLFDNIGWGLGLIGPSAQVERTTGHLTHVRIWGNGVNQFVVGAPGEADCTDVTIYPPTWTDRQWYSTQESRKVPKIETEVINPKGLVTGQTPTLSTDHQPAPDAMPKIGAKPTGA